MIKTIFVNIEQQIEARKRLVLSAKMARSQGISRDEWENSQQIRDFVLKLGLARDIPEHIAAWVWTFRR